MLAWALAAAKSAASESARIASDKYEECIIIWYVSRPPTRPDKQQQQDKMLRCHLSRRSKNKFVSSIFSRFWRVVRRLFFGPLPFCLLCEARLTFKIVRICAFRSIFLCERKDPSGKGSSHKPKSLKLKNQNLAAEKNYYRQSIN